MERSDSPGDGFCAASACAAAFVEEDTEADFDDADPASKKAVWDRDRFYDGWSKRLCDCSRPTSSVNIKQTDGETQRIVYYQQVREPVDWDTIAREGDVAERGRDIDREGDRDREREGVSERQRQKHEERDSETERGDRQKETVT